MTEFRTIGPFRVDLARGVLLREGQALPVGQRGVALFAALLAAQGQTVAKADLMQAGWPGLAVEEGNLTVQIAGLRKVLGPAPQGQDWIVTVPRLGYRLIVPQTTLPEDHFVKPSLAVMPFTNLSGDAEQDYFGDGVVEDIITALSKFRSFAVIARNSSFSYKGRAVDARQVAGELGVRYLLEGSIRRSGSHLRISTQLVECAGGQNIWAERFDGRVEQVFEFQDQITESVASRVEPSLEAAEIERTRRERPGSIAAYDLYLRALPLLLSGTDTANASGYALLNEAIRLEPQNAVFLASAAQALSDRGILGWPSIGPDDRATCAALVSRALQYAAGDSIVLAHCGDALLQFLKEYDWAQTVLGTAISANPNNFRVVVLAGVGNLHCGSIADALDLLHRAIRLSPRDPAVIFSMTGIAHAHVVQGEFEEALVWATRSLTLNPSFQCTYWMLIAANAQLGRMEEARKFLAAFRKLAPGVTVASIWAGQPQKDPSRCAAILDGLRLAGLEEG